LPYRVEYVPLADIETKLKELGVSPSSKRLFKYTLPSESYSLTFLSFRVVTNPSAVIADPSGDPNLKPTYVVDSFDIAIYLDEKYPAPKYPVVFPPGTRALQKIALSQLMSVRMSLAPVMIFCVSIRSDFFDERSHEYFTRTRSAAFDRELSTLLDSPDEYWNTAQAQWDALGDVLALGDEGPFVMGHQVSFVDFVIAGLIHALQKCEGGDMTGWKKLASWQNGRWATFWKEIVKIEAESSEVSA
jgi:glutathione S-transferase